MRILLKISRFAAAAAVAAAIALLAWQCLDIYAAGMADLSENGLSAAAMYSRDDIAYRWNRICGAMGVCAGLVILSAVLHTAAGHEREEYSAVPPENRLRLIKTRIGELPESAKKQERLRRTATICFAVPMAAAGALCLRYLFDAASFPLWSEVSPDAAVGRLMLHLLPPAMCILLLGIALAFIRRESILRELSLLRNEPETASVAVRQSVRQNKYLCIILYILAAAFILLGVLNGGMRDVLYKAINICTECIGLG